MLTTDSCELFGQFVGHTILPQLGVSRMLWGLDKDTLAFRIESILHNLEHGNSLLRGSYRCHYRSLLGLMPLFGWEYHDLNCNVDGRVLLTTWIINGAIQPILLVS